MTQGPTHNTRTRDPSLEGSGLHACPPVPDLLAQLLPVPKEVVLSHEALCVAAARFAEELTRQVPQVVDGELRYVLAGSLAVALLSQARSFTASNATDIENPSRISVHEMTEGAQRALAGIVRPIGDLDYVATSSSAERVLGKGGRLAFENFSDPARGIFKGASSGGSIMSDPLSNELNHKVACVYVNDIPVYVVSPSSMFAWKTQHVIEKLHGAECNPKFQGDWSALYEVNRSLHTHGQALAEAAEAVHASAFTARGGAILPLYRADISAELRDFIRDVIEVSPSAALARSTGAPEHRLLAIASLLDRLPEGNARVQVAGAVANNPDLVDPLEVDRKDPENIAALAHYLRTKPEALSRFASDLSERPLEQIIRTHPYLFAEYRDKVESLKRIPSRSLYLDALSRISPDAIEGDLSLIAAIKHDKRALQSAELLLSSEAMIDLSTRAAVSDAILRARPEERRDLVASLSSISGGTTEYIDNEWVRFSVETIRARLVARAESR